jgi:Na+-driven multidrug efflux pump
LKLIIESELEKFGMAKYLMIILLFSIAILIISEYFFLLELFGEKRIVVLLATVAGMLVSIFYFIYFFRKDHQRYKKF